MKIKIVKNKYWNALFVLMFFSAVAHMMVLFFITAKSANMYVLNYFHILGLDVLMPQIFSDSAMCEVAAIIFLFAFYFIILKNNKTE